MGWLLVDRIFKFGSAIAKYTLFVLLQYLISLVFELLDTLELRFFETPLVGPFLLQALQSSNLNFMQIVLLAKNVELLLHLHYQFIFELFQLYLQLTSLLLVLSSQIDPLLLRMLLHQPVHPLFLTHFQFTKLLSKI